jgi:hypothetical protein
MEGPNATFFGAARDSVGGALVEQDMLNGANIVAYEHGYETPGALVWDFKVNGEFRNNLVFANTYDIYLRNGNFFPYSIKDFVINQGDNQYDFMVVPYLRVKDADIKWDQASNTIIATFKVEAGAPIVNLKQITLYAFSDMYVGDPFKFTLIGKTFSQLFKPTISPDPSTVYTLTIDLAANEKTFKSGRNYFFRIGALGDGAGLSGIKNNYAPYVKIRL